MKYLKIVKSIKDYSNESLNLNQDEVEKVGKSLSCWSKSHNYAMYSRAPLLKRGQIIFVDFGLNYKPEMAYMHPALIIKIKNNLCTVHPCTSNSHKVAIAYHPIDNPKGAKNLYKIKAGEGGVIKDTAVILSQIFTVSIGRINTIFDVKGIDNLIFTDINNRGFNYYYNKQKIKLDKEISYLKMQLVLSSIPNAVQDISEISVDSNYELIHTELADGRIEIVLKDLYKQKISKIVAKH